MLIVGDLSGIHEYLFDLPPRTRGQAMVLRARSLTLQLLAECAAIRLIQAASLKRDSLLFCSAGRFGIFSRDFDEQTLPRIRQELVSIERWLINRTAGRVHLATAIDHDPNPPASPAEYYEKALAQLEIDKLQPWSTLAQSPAAWLPSNLILHHAPDTARSADIDADLGRLLPAARWLVVREHDGSAVSHGASLEMLGFDITISPLEKPVIDASTVALANLRDPRIPPEEFPLENFLHRPLSRYVPAAPNGQPLDFDRIAARSSGDAVLGVLRMDVDSSSAAIFRRLRRSRDLLPLRDFSLDLDSFFSYQLDQELRHPQWDSIYTVFSGGDDLLLVGPWNTIIDFAGHARQLFHQRFEPEGMTISAGIALAKPRGPIRAAVEESASLLQLAKTRRTSRTTEPLDQVACLGQVWKWHNHGAVISAAKRLVAWVHTGLLSRSWLHELLEITAVRRGMAPSRESLTPATAAATLAAHAARRYPRPNDRDPRTRELRRWMDKVIQGFDEFARTTDIDTLYLPALVRYALLATRHGRQEIANE